MSLSSRGKLSRNLVNVDTVTGFPSPVSLGFSYSARGEITDTFQSSPHATTYYHVATTYWPNGLVNTLNTNLCSVPAWKYMPDGEGRVFSVGASSGQAPVTATLYNGFSQPMSITYGSADSDNLSYDPNTGRMIQFLGVVGSQSQTGDVYWNANGSLFGLIINDSANSTNTQTCTYTHDDLSRLAKVDCGSGKWGQSFAYDTFGNISKTNLSGRTGINFLPTYSTSTNHYSTLPAGTPAYDSNGNLTNDSYHTYAWDSDGNMATIGGTTALTYDALDRRVELAQSSTYTQTLYGPGGAKLALLNGANVAKVFLPLPGGATAVYTSSGLAYYRHPDWLGSSRLASTPSRTVYYDGAYAPFGESYAETGTTDRNFTGQNQDTASDLYDFLYREYHPTQGRWIQPDPAGLAAVDISNPQSWNRYGYVLNGPLTAVDSLGLFGGVPVTTTFTGGPCTTTVTFFLYYPPDNASMPIVMSNSSTSCQAVTIGGRTGSPPTTGPSAPPKNGNIAKTVTQNCLADYNNSAAGKVIQFFSLYNLATNIKGKPGTVHAFTRFQALRSWGFLAARLHGCQRVGRCVAASHDGR